jgi:hypothetical protein
MVPFPETAGRLLFSRVPAVFKARIRARAKRSLITVAAASRRDAAMPLIDVSGSRIVIDGQHTIARHFYAGKERKS